jgi:predicted enzyme related to lactoylglutathione lyase
LELARATAFYEAAFSVKLSPPTKVGPNDFAFFPMEMNKAGAAGTLIHGECITPSHQGSTVYFGVESIDKSLPQIAAAGGKTLMPKTNIGQYGFIAFFEDTEGNRVGLHEQPGM